MASKQSRFRPAHSAKLLMLTGTLLRHEVAELIVLQRHKVFDRTCCSPNSTLPGQLMYGEASPSRVYTTEKEP
jgi:hypothetical protein